MKIEAAESLFLSWLRHVKECQLVQTNWKPSPQWGRKNEEVLERLMLDSSDFFKSKYNYDLYKGTKSVDQLLKQAEIDVIGIAFDDGKVEMYAIDVAFHEAGLNYGSKEETVARIIKKCLRAAMCISGYFGYTDAEIIFASPKINPAVANEITFAINDVNQFLKQVKLNYKIRIIANHDLREHVLSPILSVLSDVADTSELFMRSLQLYSLIEGMHPFPTPVLQPSKQPITPLPFNTDDPLSEMKIGVIVRTVFRNILESGNVPKDEIERMQDKEYSRETFGIQYPVLQKKNESDKNQPKRYYAGAVKIYDKDYFICSEWYETSANNDRKYLMEWLKPHTCKKPIGLATPTP
jgi:hypothetical protein